MRATRLLPGEELAFGEPDLPGERQKGPPALRVAR